MATVTARVGLRSKSERTQVPVRVSVVGARSTDLGKVVQEPRASFNAAEWRVFCHQAKQ